MSIDSIGNAPDHVIPIPHQVRSWTAGDLGMAGAVVIDGRAPDEFDAVHVRDALNLPLPVGRVPHPLTGLIAAGTPVVAAAADARGACRLAGAVRAEGFAVAGVLVGGIAELAESGLPVQRAHAVSADQLIADLRLGGVVLVDAGTSGDRIAGSIHIPPERCAQIAPLLPRTPIAVAADDEPEAAIVASALRHFGHRNVWRVRGGGMAQLVSRRLSLALV